MPSTGSANPPGCQDPRGGRWHGAGAECSGSSDVAKAPEGGTERIAFFFFFLARFVPDVPVALCLLADKGLESQRLRSDPLVPLRSASPACPCPKGLITSVFLPLACLVPLQRAPWRSWSLPQPSKAQRGPAGLQIPGREQQEPCDSAPLRCWGAAGTRRAAWRGAGCGAASFGSSLYRFLSFLSHEKRFLSRWSCSDHGLLLLL